MDLNFEKSGYLAHAMLPVYKNKIQRSAEIIQQALATIQKPYIGMSFGKDSLVMSHMILKIAPSIPLIYVDCGEFDEWPDTPRVKKRFIEMTGCQLIELTAPSIIEFYRKAGHVYIQDGEQTKEELKIQREYSRSMMTVVLAYVREHGYDGGFIGMRKSESIIRRMLLKKRGELYFGKTNGIWSCCPVSHWTGKDIWAYIYQHDLPYNELYDLSPNREIARNGAMVGTRGMWCGRVGGLRQMYPDWYNRLVMEFPEIDRWL